MVSRKHRRLSKRNNWKIFRYENGNSEVHYECKYKSIFRWRKYKECDDDFEEFYYVKEFDTEEEVEKFIKKKVSQHKKY